MKLHQIKQQFQSGAIDKGAYIDEMSRLHERLFEYAEFIKDTDIRSIEIADGKLVMTSRAAGIKLLCSNQDKRMAGMDALNFGSYEHEEVAMVLRLMKPGQTVLDIGANIGWYSISIAKRFPDSVIHAFEPVPATYSQLRTNLMLNDMDNVHAHNFGFSDQEKALGIYYCPDCSVGASAANILERDEAQFVQCKMKTIDGFIDENDISIDFIKCDVEGAELFVYQGGLKSIKKHNPIIFSELLRKWAAKFNYSPNDIIDLLAGCGYLCFAVHEDKLIGFDKMDDNTMETNFFFLHSEKHVSEITQWTKC